MSEQETEEQKPSKSGEEYIKFCQEVLNDLRAHLAGNGEKYVTSDAFIDIFLKMRRLSVANNEYPFTHHIQVKQILNTIQREITKSTWAFLFKHHCSARSTKLENERKLELAKINQKKAEKRYEDCGPGEWASEKNNKPSATFINAQLLLKRLNAVALYNEFTEKKTIQIDGKDVDVGTLRNMMWDEVFVEFSEATVNSAMDAYCRRFRFHPIKDYFDEVRHLPNKGLIDTWLTVVVGAEDTPLNREIGKKLFVAIVARIYEPGIKFDQMIVLESGRQGIGKSTLLEIIAGTAYFNSGKILSMEPKEQMEALKGRMIYESADLVGHGKADVESVKAFLSQTADRGRWAYAPEVRDHPRTAIIVGTTNKNVYLLDETGNRRVWPVLCNVVPTETMHDGKLCPNEVNLQWLRDNRDQLFSEAIALYESEYPLELARSLWANAAVLQNQRLVDVPLTDEVWEILGFTAQEGLLVKDDVEHHTLDLRIFTRDIIKGLFPTLTANTVIGRNVKTAMQNLNVYGDDLRWEYKACLRIDDVAGSGWQLTVTKQEHYDFLKKTIAGWKRRREAKGIANATL